MTLETPVPWLPASVDGSSLSRSAALDRISYQERRAGANGLGPATAVAVPLYGEFKRSVSQVIAHMTTKGHDHVHSTESMARSCGAGLLGREPRLGRPARAWGGRFPWPHWSPAGLRRVAGDGAGIRGGRAPSRARRVARG